MKGVIARIDWRGCSDCIFSDKEKGGCSIDEQEITDNLELDLLSESISCGCFKERDAEKRMEWKAE